MPPVENSPYSAVNMVRHLWSRRLLFLILVPLFLVLSVSFTRTFLGEVFQSSAMLRVRTPPSTLRTGPALDNLNPRVYERMLLNDGLLHQVIEKARERFPEFPRGNFERAKGSFEVEVIMTRDTALVAEYSPVLLLTAKSGKPEWAHFLATTWLELSLNSFGLMRHQEAVEIQDKFRAQFDALNTRAEELQLEEGTLQQEILLAGNILQARNRILTGMGGGLATLGGGGSTQPGLLEEAVQLRLAIAESDESEKPRLEARLAKVEELIAETRAEIETLGRERVAKSQRLDTAREELVAVREEIADVREIMVNMISETTLLDDPNDPSIQGAFAVLSNPVMPEMRVAPPRAVYAGVMAGVLSGVLLLLILIEFYLKGALAATSRR